MQAKATLPFQSDRNKPIARFQIRTLPQKVGLLASALFAAAVCLLTAAKPADPFVAMVGPRLSCSLPAPATLDADRTSGTTAYAAWSAVSGAESYSLKVYEQGTLVLVSSTVVGGTSATVGGLDAGKSYQAVLASMCSAGSVSEFVIVEDIADP